MSWKPSSSSASCSPSHSAHSRSRLKRRPDAADWFSFHDNVDVRSSLDHSLGNAVERFVHREAAERSVQEVRGDDPKLASHSVPELVCAKLCGTRLWSCEERTSQADARSCR